MSTMNGWMPNFQGATLARKSDSQTVSKQRENYVTTIILLAHVSILKVLLSVKLPHWHARNIFPNIVER